MLVEEKVELYNGEQALRNECRQFTIGKHADEWFHEEDSDALTLTSGLVCHITDDQDDIYDTFCGDRFHEAEQEDLDIIWVDSSNCYAYQCDCTYGIIDYRGNEGYFIDSYEDYVHDDYNDVYYISERVANYNDVYWYDSIDEYRHVDDAPDEEEEEEERNAYSIYDDPNNTNYVHTYHLGLSGTVDRRWRCDRDTAEFTMGFEVEKEDYDAKHSCYANQLPHFWTKERDGSLDDSSGYELISPVYDLFGTLHEEDINGSDLLQQHINGGYSKKCGGHIHIGAKDMTSSELFEKVSGFLPMLYSIYEHRLNLHWCQVKKKHEYLNRDKYSAVYVRNHTCEFRIFPAVKNVSMLMWRIGLLRIIVQNLGATEKDVLKMLCDSSSALHQHIAAAVGKDKMMRKIALFIEYSSTYNDVDLNDEDNQIK